MRMGFMLNVISQFAQSSSGSEAAGTAVGLGVGLFFVVFWLAVMALGIVGIVLWIISLVHVLQHNDVKDRVMWIVLLLVVGNIGGVIYFFAIKRPYDRGGMRDPLVVAANEALRQKHQS